ncbi:MAG: DUF2625 family protein [Myxococcota bacterium]
MHYLAPDTLDWEDSGLGYSDWLNWALTDGLEGFYGHLRWDGWAREVESLDGGSGLVFFPPLFAEAEAHATRVRSVVPVDELWRLALRYRAELGDLRPGARFDFRVVP